MDQAELFSDRTQLSKDAGPASTAAAQRARLRVGSWRAEVFRGMVEGSLMTTWQVYHYLARTHPCEHCGCWHRGPKPINEIGTRFGDLRDLGYIRRVLDDEGEPLTRVFDGQPYEVHTVTNLGQSIHDDIYGAV